MSDPQMHQDHTAANANAAYFNAMAQYANPCVSHVNLALADYIKTKLAARLTPQATVLDFACGPGLVSQSVRPHVKSLLGADVSSNMLDQFKKLSVDLGQEAGSDTLLLKDGLLPEDAPSFDLIICTLAYHHFDDAKAVSTMLSKHLNPGGLLLVADLAKAHVSEATREQFKNLHNQKVVPHDFGYTPEHFTSLFEGGSFKSIDLDYLKLSKKHLKTLEGSEKLGLMLEDNDTGDNFELMLAHACKA